MKVLGFGDRIVIDAEIGSEKETPGGIIIPRNMSNKDKYIEGKVISKGKGSPFIKGEIVVCHRRSVVELYGKYVIKEQDVIAVLQSEE